MRAPAAIALLLLTLVCAPDLQAQCTAGNDPTQTVDRIQLVPSGFPSGLSNAVANGMGMWNGTSCNTGGDDFPLFQFDSAGAGRTITVMFVAGKNPQNPASCGNLAGNVISVYSQVNNPITGGTASCAAADIVTQNIAHELGHLLGLDNQFSSSCYGFIMSQVVFQPNGAIIGRSVRPEECQQANTSNITFPEQPPPDNDPYCDAYCWTSCENGQCPTRPDGYDPGCPVVFDLDGNGFHFAGPNDAVSFDLNANGAPESMTWTAAGEGDAFLVLDRNGDGVVNDGSELFGTSTPMTNGELAPNGYVALAEFDTPFLGGDEDAWIGATDLGYWQLQLWLDDNHNGLSEPEELLTLPEAGVTRIGLRYVRSERRDPHGNYLRFAGKAWGSTDRTREHVIQTIDVFFQYVE
jgi:hypothetical protein